MSGYHAAFNEPHEQLAIDTDPAPPEIPNSPDILAKIPMAHQWHGFQTGECTHATLRW